MSNKINVRVNVKADVDALLKSIQRNESPGYFIGGIFDGRNWLCLLCETECYRTVDSNEWIHRGTNEPWCARDKQHGPQTRTCHPVPGLLIINELEEP